MSSLDFQKKGLRGKNPVSFLLEKMNEEKMSFWRFFSSLIKMKRLILGNNFSLAQWRILRNKLIKTYLFQRLIFKSHDFPHFLIQKKLPQDILNNLLAHVLQDHPLHGVTQKELKISKNSPLAGWIRENYLKEAKRRFFGVVGYSAHIRYAANDGSSNFWDERFITKHANFHWDRDPNSFTLIIYLSDVTLRDGPFKVLKSSINYPHNLYLSAYDEFVSDIRGFDGHQMSDRAGRYIDHLPEDEIITFARPKGTALIFDGRHILHDGGFPDAHGHRKALFIDSRNIYSGLLRRIFG